MHHQPAAPRPSRPPFTPRAPGRPGPPVVGPSAATGPTTDIPTLERKGGREVGGRRPAARRVGCPRHNLISHRLGGQRGWLSGWSCHDSSPETCCAHVCPSSVTTVDQPRPSIEGSDRCKPARGHAAQAGRECAATRVPRDCGRCAATRVPRDCGGRWRRWGGVEVKAEVVNRSPSAVIAPSSSGLQKEARARVADGGLLGCGVGRGCDQLCSGTFSHGCRVALAANGVGGGAAGCPLRLGAHCGSAVHATSVISASFGSEAVEEATHSISPNGLFAKLTAKFPMKSTHELFFFF